MIKETVAPAVNERVLAGLQVRIGVLLRGKLPRANAARSVLLEWNLRRCTAIGIIARRRNRWCTDWPFDKSSKFPSPWARAIADSW
jgi:hypothetical protein